MKRAARYLHLAGLVALLSAAEPAREAVHELDPLTVNERVPLQKEAVHTLVETRYGAEGAANKLIAYDLVGKTSRAFPLSHDRVQHAAMVVHAGKIYMLGGATLRGRDASRNIQVFSPPVPRI